MSYLIFNVTTFHQELKVGRMKDQVRIFNSINQHELIISEIAFSDGSFYFPLPKELRNPKKEQINIQNKDNECFRQGFVRYLNPINKNQKKIRNIDKVFGKKLDLRGIKFPTHKKEYAKIEKQNNISINVFGYGNEKPYHIYT